MASSAHLLDDRAPPGAARYQRQVQPLQPRERDIGSAVNGNRNEDIQQSGTSVEFETHGSVQTTQWLCSATPASVQPLRRILVSDKPTGHSHLDDI